MKTYIGIDPGVKNFAIVALDAKGCLQFAYMLNNTIKSMKRVDATQRDKYINSMRKILAHLAKNSDCALIFEQFIVRGFGAHISELINLMLGGMLVMCTDLKIETHNTAASTWKGYLRRAGFELQSLYDDARMVGIPPHIVDAILMATYLRDDMSFKNFNLKLFQKNVECAVDLLVESKLIKPKRIVMNEVPARSRPRGRRKVSGGKVLVSSSQGKKKLRGV